MLSYTPISCIRIIIIITITINVYIIFNIYMVLATLNFYKFKYLINLYNI